MAYAKLTVEHFAINLKEGKYAGLTGARRAIGKVTDWHDVDRKRAHALADKHFGSPDAATSKTNAKKPAKKATKKAAKVAKRAATKTATKLVAKPAPKRAKKAGRATFAKHDSLVASDDSAASAEPRVLRVPGDDPATVRQQASLLILAAFRNSGPLSPREQRTYALAQAEYELSVSDGARALADAERGTASVPVKVGKSAPKAPASAPRIVVPETPVDGDVAPVPPIDLAHMTPAERTQHDALTRAARAAKVPIPPVINSAAD